ncbi:MAG: molybdopterin-dependent oxidoreductase [Burkholderiales bacterium]|nr:molybdopterin-dependent oxidoreductase [Burkholderiales bacterium]
MSESSIGRDTPQVGAREKLTGRALYAGDLKPAGMLHARVLRSPYAHARIVRIDTSRARALAGVRLVVTGADTPVKLTGVHRKEHRILAVDRVRHVGEEVAAVVAISEDIARDAIDLIEVEYEELPALFDPDAALAEGAVEVHAGTRNLAYEMNIAYGDVEGGFARAAAIHEAIYDSPSQYPGYLEPMATVAAMGGDGRLTVWTSTQSVFLARARYAEALEMPVSKVRVIQAVTGGGFGGKIVEETNSLICAFLASRLDRPVRFVNNRLDDFLGARASVPERVRLKLGVDADGRIVAKEVEIIAECGAYQGLTAHVMYVTAMRSDNMHRIQNVRTRARLVYTHNPPRGAFRGFGGQQMGFALNCALDDLAARLGRDPLDLHRINAIGQGETSVHGWKIGSTGMLQCLEQVRSAVDWDARRSRAKGGGVKRRGIGMAAAMHVSGNRTIGNWDGSTVHLRISEDGRATLLTAECDMGQGAYTVLAQLCAHELSIPVEHVTVAQPDTDAAAFAIGSLASRVTIVAGNAVVRAAREARDKLVALAAEKLEAAPADLEAVDGVVRLKGVPGHKLTYAELARMHIFRNGGEGLQVKTTWDAPTVQADAKYFGNVAPAHSFAVQATEVEVDTETGQVTVIDTFVSDDCGKALNPMAIHGQTAGAVVQAIGWTLHESLQYENGRLMNGNFADYTMPLARAVPMIRTGIVESMDPTGPLGAKGASETAIVPGAAAIANAVYDAIGVRITALPITPEKILAALAMKREAGHA